MVWKEDLVNELVMREKLLMNANTFIIIKIKTQSQERKQYLGVVS